MIDGNYFLINVSLLAVGTLLIRGSFIALSSRLHISSKVKDLFTFIPAAIFPAIVVPMTFFHKGSVDWLGGHERFIVLIIASVVCYFIRNTLFVILSGLLLLYALCQL
jgi:branched-subunit amino acid transport protein